jgi:hemoglobin
MTDIQNREDVKKLVNLFYEKVRQDELLSPVFRDVDWPLHLPVMYDFWSSILFGDLTYQGNPFQKHQHLLLERAHFERWLRLFFETVDQNFSGEKAGEVKQRAGSIAGIFQYKMGLLK